MEFMALKGNCITLNLGFQVIFPFSMGNGMK